MNILTNRIEYQVGDASHQGYLAYDNEISATRPGIIIVHEWWGLNDYIVQRAHMLAELGYVALAIDMFGGGRVAETPDEAASLMNGVLDDMETGTAALKAGYQLLQNQVGVDAERTAAIGYCFGGAMVLHMARIGLPLSAVASFHGALGSFHQAEPGSIKPTILVCHGAADSMVSMADLESFKQEMTQAKADFEVLLLADARHGFSNPQASVNAEKYGLDLGYQQQADAKSWAAMQALFDRVF
ncbi:MAG: dienelactone hydrolase family protein [Gammaproteobacteria bacterium]|jgi:dienelactone hydrolase|nr:dienelactone hydrolase family protein [Gammaproteobacteria bacterium]HUV20411.1 dienelactone hydrolase family protein [Gammaproteobacteria bacterium]